MSKIRKKLQAARTGQTLVRVVRTHRFATGYLEGFVVGIGKRWALLAQVENGGWPNGYIAFRLQDTKSVRTDKTMSERFARLQPEWPPLNPFADLNLAETSGVIAGLAADHTLIGIEKENERAALWIGTLDDIWPKWVWLNELDPTAAWLPKPLGYRLRDITTVQKGTRYLDALQQIADPRLQLEG